MHVSVSRSKSVRISVYPLSWHDSVWVSFSLSSDRQTVWISESVSVSLSQWAPVSYCESLSQCDSVWVSLYLSHLHCESAWVTESVWVSVSHWVTESVWFSVNEWVPLSWHQAVWATVGRRWAGWWGRWSVSCRCPARPGWGAGLHPPPPRQGPGQRKGQRSRQVNTKIT